ncbi:MAG: DUF1566 domain-containing protein [Marinagarivorans sp.]
MTRWRTGGSLSGGLLGQLQSGAWLVLLLAQLSACGGAPGGGTTASSSSSSGSTSSSGRPWARGLNDTGIHSCQGASGFVDCSAAPWQDAQQGRDAVAQAGLLAKQGAGPLGFDFTKLDNTGRPLVLQNLAWQQGSSEASGKTWSCVLDNHTGLVWEVKQDDPSSPRHYQHKFSWYQTDYRRNGGEPGSPGAPECGTIACDTQAYINALNALQLCGQSHWRLPSIGELMSIVWGGRAIKAIDEGYFANSPGTQYWTGQSYAPNNLHAWYLYLGDGSLGNQQKSSRFYVRLVADLEKPQ